ncbi:hypothetical protein AAD001_13380 [Colwelliaceae bacterium 6471]
MLDKNDQPVSKDSLSPKDENIQSNSRRGFFKKAALGSAIITTISSRPVWAGQCTLSGNLSNNTSNPNETETCTLHGYSGGAWCNGHANNHGFWALVGKSKSDAVVSLLGATPHANVTIGQALGCSETNHIPKNQQGLWKQRTCAALNLLLWEIIKDDYINNENCVSAIYGDIHANFYFPTTLDIIMNASVNELDNANRDGFSGGFLQTC